MFILILMLISITFVTRSFLDNRPLIHMIDCAPIVFTFCVLLYFVRRNKISLTQLW
jgi:hypothetical protein